VGDELVQQTFSLPLVELAHADPELRHLYVEIDPRARARARVLFPGEPLFARSQPFNTNRPPRRRKVDFFIMLNKSIDRRQPGFQIFFSAIPGCLRSFPFLPPLPSRAVVVAVARLPP